MKEIPEYTTPQDFRCPECGELCQIVPLRNEFDYAGTHCTHGLPGIHCPFNWGQPVSDCCEAPMSQDYEDIQNRQMSHRTQDIHQLETS